jgi:hypothetical protein
MTEVFDMGGIAEKRVAFIIVGWSLLCAITIIGASLASNYWGAPDATYWIIALWWIGFSFAVVHGLRCRK